jgi:peptidoglycan hydrolase-like amidase
MQMFGFRTHRENVQHVPLSTYTKGVTLFSMPVNAKIKAIDPILQLLELEA